MIVTILPAVGRGQQGFEKTGTSAALETSRSRTAVAFAAAGSEKTTRCVWVVSVSPTG